MKKILCIVLIIAMAAMLFSCKKNNENQPDTNGDAATSSETSGQLLSIPAGSDVSGSGTMNRAADDEEKNKKDKNGDNDSAISSILSQEP